MDCDSMTNGFDVDAALAIIAEHDAAKPCPNVVVTDGAAYCRLAETTVAALHEEIAGLKGLSIQNDSIIAAKNAEIEEIGNWRATFQLLGGTPEIAWQFYKGVETQKIVQQYRADDAEALITEKDKALRACRAYMPIMQPNETRTELEAALALTPADMGKELAALREDKARLDELLAHHEVVWMPAGIQIKTRGEIDAAKKGQS